MSHFPLATDEDGMCVATDEDGMCVSLHVSMYCRLLSDLDGNNKLDAEEVNFTFVAFVVSASPSALCPVPSAFRPSALLFCY